MKIKNILKSMVITASRLGLLISLAVLITVVMFECSSYVDEYFNNSILVMWAYYNLYTILEIFIVLFFTEEFYWYRVHCTELAKLKIKKDERRIC